MASLCAMANLVESGLKAMPRMMYPFGLLGSAGLVLNLSFLSPFSSNRYTTLSVVTAASFWLHSGQQRVAVPQALRHVITAWQICIHGPAEDSSSVVSLVWGPSQGCDLLQSINRAQHRLEMSKLHVGQSATIPADCCLWRCRQSLSSI